jgi:GMP synthase (glutamine-hydrolysing)
MYLRGIAGLFVGLVFIWVLVAHASTTDLETAPQQAAGSPDGMEVPASHIWVVVNLFSGKSSKQALRVRETFVRLGAGGQGIILPFGDVNAESMRKLRPAFLALSPNGVPWCDYSGEKGENLDRFLKALKVIVEDMSIPVIGICGGHQALALAFGGKVGPIQGGEDECLPYGKTPTEKGRHFVQVVDKDPIFLGMGKELNMVENHFDEVKKLPPGFICLAGNKLCPYQIIRHPARPAYGVQAHCEYYLSTRPDGGVLLRNFLRIVRAHNQAMRNASDQQQTRASSSQESLKRFRKATQPTESR